MENSLLPDAENGTYYPAGSPLELVISHFYHFDFSMNKESVSHQLVPNLEMMLAFSFGTPVEIKLPKALSTPLVVSRSAIIGPLRQLLQYKLEPGADLLLINFKFNGFHRLFSNGIKELKQTGATGYEGVIADADWMEDWWEELAKLPDTEQRIARFTELTIAAISTSDMLTSAIIANNIFFNDPKLDPAKAFAESNGVTPRAIQLRFQQTVGYSVKELLRYLRFKAVVTKIVELKGIKPNLMELVEAHNYHDQSHLNKDFKYFLGMSPLQFFKQLKSGSICINADTYSSTS
ncbi:AraC-like DNA-binding protein [Pedobacter sp. UYP24]